MNAQYFNLLRDAGKAAATHVGLVNGTGTQVGTGRIAETWVNDGDGVMRLAADRVFDITAGQTVAGWQAYSAATGGTAYGVNPLPSENFTNDGQYRLRADLTAITHQAPA
jgi:hypothetical protein